MSPNPELCVRWKVPDALDDGGWTKPYAEESRLSGSEDFRRSARPPYEVYSDSWRRR